MEKAHEDIDQKTQGHERLKTLITALLVAGALLAALVYTSLLTQPKSNTSIFRWFDPGVSGIQAEPEDSIDAFVVGDSLTLNGFLPLNAWHEYGISTYTLATLAQPLPDGNTMLHLGLRNQHPRVVMFEVQPLFEGTTFDAAVMSTASRIFPVLRYHSRWRQLTAADFALKQQAYEINPNHGAKFERATMPVDEKLATTYMAPTNESEPIDAFCSWYFERMIDYCRAAGATPVLISIPCPQSWSMAHHNAMTSWANERGLDYYDFNLLTDEIGIDWSDDSRDGGLHLNVKGAIKFTRYVSQLLVDKYGLQDHRGDASYAQWDLDYDEVY